MSDKQQVNETSKKPPRKGGKKPFRGAKDGVPFSKANQPSPQAKKAGWAKKKFNRALIKEMLNLKYKFPDSSLIKKQLEENMGMSMEDMPAGTVMVLQQIQKAILKGDTNAFYQLMAQAEGLPKQSTDITTNGKDIKSAAAVEFTLSI